MEDECQHHIDRPHQGHGSSLLDLKGLCEEGLPGDTQDSYQHQQPAVATTVGDFPLSEDGCGDEALDEADDSVVPDGEVVMDALPHLAKDNECTSSPNSSWDSIQKENE